jgi:hypothetical protein
VSFKTKVNHEHQLICLISVSEFDSINFRIRNRSENAIETFDKEDIKMNLTIIIGSECSTESMVGLKGRILQQGVANLWVRRQNIPGTLK